MYCTNISILQEIGIKQRLSALVQNRILKFFWHVSRRERDSIERHVVQGKVEGTRGQGRTLMLNIFLLGLTAFAPVVRCQLTIGRGQWAYVYNQLSELCHWLDQIKSNGRKEWNE
ncbi:jg1303, partial [Pararge aegeria aegeria]